MTHSLLAYAAALLGSNAAPTIRLYGAAPILFRVEEWRPTVGVAGYEVSSLGDVRNLNGRHLRPRPNKGYLEVFMCVDGKQLTKSVHRLVAEAFIPNPDGLPVVNHINGVKASNGDDNLEWCTRSQNYKHAARLGLVHRAAHHWNNKTVSLSMDELLALREDHLAGMSNTRIAKKYSRSVKTVARLLLRGAYGP